MTKGYGVILKNKDGSTLDLGKVIFDSYNFPFKNDIIEILKYDSICINTHRYIYVPPTNINFKLEID